jgi:hypothetical protein
MMFPKYIPSLP